MPDISEERDEMEEKIRNILTHMIREDSSVGIKGFSETVDGFQLETPLSEFNHRTILKYEATGDEEMFRIEIMHVFGRFDVDVPPAAAAGQLLRMLAHNTGSFSTTTAFIGALSEDGAFYATLNSFHHFVTSWDDKEIANALNLHLFDLTMGLTTHDSKLTMLKMFGA